MSETVVEPSSRSEAESRSQPTVSRARLALQIAAAVFVGAAVSAGGFGAFAPLLRGDTLRGLIVIALLVVGGALAVWAPFRLRGWPAALCGALAAGLVQLITGLGLVAADGDAVAAAEGMAAGFAFGGVLAAMTHLPGTGRAGLAAGFTAGLLLGTWSYALPYVPVVLAMILAGVAATSAQPPGWVTLGLAPLAALMTAVLLAGVVAQSFGLVAFLPFLVIGPVIAGVGAWWLTPKVTTPSH